MHFSITSLLLALTVTTWTPAINALVPVPINDPMNGDVPSRPYCPSRPASSAFQRAAFHELISEFFGENETEQVFLDFVSDDYIQHNPFILSGRNNSIAALRTYFTDAKFTILQVLFDSPFGMVHYRVDQPGQAPTAFTDIWRFNGTCIEEHWDVIQALPANATNPLALF
jgi:predicted SnoaL-like aldol condensation-catalyzing enzyme